MYYTPNLADPRILKRIATAYGFARGCLSSTPRAWSKAVLDNIFGQQQHPLSRWLRAKLLICVDNNYSYGNVSETKKYVLNESGANEIKMILKGCASSNSITYLSVSQVGSQVDSIIRPEEMFDYVTVKEWIEREFIDQLRSGKFVYEDKSNRLWNNIQNLRTKWRGPLLAEHGYKYDYDIECAAPTLILQHAQHNGMDLYLPALMGFIDDRSGCRKRIAQVASISEKNAKVLINALFCGAKLGANRDFALYHLLGGDFRKVRLLQHDPWLTQLRADIKTCWEYIAPTMTRIERKSKKTGKMRRAPINSRTKWARYFQLERSVMNEVRKYLQKTRNMHFNEHDGVKTKKKVNLDELHQLIFEKTGFKIRMKETIMPIPPQQHYIP